MTGRRRNDQFLICSAAKIVGDYRFVPWVSGMGQAGMGAPKTDWWTAVAPVAFAAVRARETTEWLRVRPGPIILWGCQQLWPR